MIVRMDTSRCMSTCDARDDAGQWHKGTKGLQKTKKVCGSMIQGKAIQGLSLVRYPVTCTLPPTPEEALNMGEKLKHGS